MTCAHSAGVCEACLGLFHAAIQLADRGALVGEIETPICERCPNLEPSMATVTKKELIDRIAEETGAKRVLVKRIIQGFLDNIIDELGNGNRLEFRDFGVFECKIRAARRAQNPKTLEPVDVAAKRTVKFKIGRLMKDRLVGDGSPPPNVLDAVTPPRSTPDQTQNA